MNRCWYVPIVARWEFDYSVDGWSNDMKMELRHEAGELKGTWVGPNPHLDSPLFALQATARTYVILRLQHTSMGTYHRVLAFICSH
jgi:hypothetical protein